MPRTHSNSRLPCRGSQWWTLACRLPIHKCRSYGSPEPHWSRSAAALEAQQRAERALSESAAEMDYGMAQAALAAATAQQRTLDELRKIRR